MRDDDQQTDVTGTKRSASTLSRSEIARYERHLRLPEVGEAGQRKLRNASVLIVGVGGLGCPAALYLAAAGVGRLGLVDPDLVDMSNLQRQVLFSEADIGQPKVERARVRLEALNPCISIESHQQRLGAANGPALVSRYDLVLDGTDNFASRYLLNDLCIADDKALISGSLHRFDGQVSVFWASRGPCYRCLFPAPPPAHLVPNCAEAGVLGVLPGLIGTLQATEALKLILSLGESLIGRLLTVESLGMGFQDFHIPRDPACPSCGPYRKAATEPGETEHSAASEGDTWDLTPRQVKAAMTRGEAITLLDIREPWEWELARIDGATMIPLSDLPQRMEELDRSTRIVVFCEVGKRSGWLVQHLRSTGFSHAYNLSGGIVAWALQIGSSPSC